MLIQRHLSVAKEQVNIDVKIPCTWQLQTADSGGLEIVVEKRRNLIPKHKELQIDVNRRLQRQSRKGKIY